VSSRSQSERTGPGAVTVAKTMQATANKSQLSMYAITGGRWRQKAH
jgi:hypothetical protein